MAVSRREARVSLPQAGVVAQTRRRAEPVRVPVAVRSPRSRRKRTALRGRAEAPRPASPAVALAEKERGAPQRSAASEPALRVSAARSRAVVAVSRPAGTWWPGALARVSVARRRAGLSSAAGRRREAALAEAVPALPAEPSAMLRDRQPGEAARPSAARPAEPRARGWPAVAVWAWLSAERAPERWLPSGGWRPAAGPVSARASAQVPVSTSAGAVER